MMILLWVLVILGAIYVLALFLTARYCIRPMRIPIFLSPGALGLPQARTEFTSSDGVLLRGWWMDHETPKSVVVLAHGYMMNRSEPIPLAKRLHEEGLACLIFDFRCHGSSTGKQCTFGYRERYDLAAAVEQAKQRYPGQKVWVWGSSMGGAASVLAVSQNAAEVDALALDSVYANLFEANDGWWQTFLGSRLKWLVKPVWLFCWMMTGIDPRKVNITDGIRQLNGTPTWLAYGDDDLIVPKALAEKNAAANPEAVAVWFPGCQHSQPRWLETQRYDQELLRFLRANDLA